jgi:hypothetical protein
MIKRSNKMSVTGLEGLPLEIFNMELSRMSGSVDCASGTCDKRNLNPTQPHVIHDLEFDTIDVLELMAMA